MHMAAGQVSRRSPSAVLNQRLAPVHLRTQPTNRLTWRTLRTDLFIHEIQFTSSTLGGAHRKCLKKGAIPQEKRES